MWKPSGAHKKLSDAQRPCRAAAALAPAATVTAEPAASIYSGIQPYSGTTTVAQVPVDCHCVTHYGQ